ncbi:MAG: 4Fe-4S cluster-binding domain-containing protein [Spirochaetes bacterium]|jgi:putative pyruvate formate lyase activating enzyme|nr:4Fe-4S cluster-binding domain-containing protein [Spirochaetota bacterium]
MRQNLSCSRCPRECGTDRGSGSGYCKSGTGFEIASICRHAGEEPVLGGETGVCNIFFSHCNLQCVYCQNFQISRNGTSAAIRDIDDLTEIITGFLDEGVGSVGFVSPSHMIPQMIEIINAVKEAGYNPAFIMNTNAYDKCETIQMLSGLIDVYLPDFKYMDPELSRDLSGAYDYPDVALKAIREMYRQKGSGISISQNGTIESGLIIRHLVLPGNIENSRRCLRTIAEELSTSVHISLMSQYRPLAENLGHPFLGKKVTRDEYEELIEEMFRLGFHRGWVQELESPDCYMPDFSLDDPFENRRPF